MCTIGKCHRSTRVAFTMVEIIVVITIISVILMMTMVSLSGAVGGVAVKEAAGNLLASLRYAHDYAAIHGCECRVSFSRIESTYELTCKTDPSKDKFERMPAASHAKLSDRVHFVSVAIQQRTADAVGDVITFEPTGESDGASIVVSDGRDTYSLIVAPASGLTQLKHGAVSDIVNDREDLDA